VEVHRDGTAPRLRGPKGVGYQRDFWGPPDLAKAMEEAFNRCETPALELLKRIDHEVVLKLTKPERGLLAEFAAVHVVRLPAFGAFLCSGNAGLRSQAAKDWVSRPGTSPPFVVPPQLHPNIYAISTELIPGYTVDVAVNSKGRTATDEMVAKLIEENAPRDRARWVAVTG
jgi:uncharacterized protein DUF4238